MTNDNENERPESEASPSWTPRVEHALESSDPPGRATSGPTTSRATEGNDFRTSRGSAQENEHPVLGGPRTRVPGSRPVDPSIPLIAAFHAGDPERAYEAALDLRRAYHEAMTEAARLRFKLHFGSATCDRCSGLVAGPDVAATCFQVRLCNYTNVKIGDADLQQRNIIDKISKK